MLACICDGKTLIMEIVSRVAERQPLMRHSHVQANPARTRAAAKAQKQELYENRTYREAPKRSSSVWCDIVVVVIIVSRL